MGNVAAVTDAEEFDMVNTMDRHIKAHFGPLSPAACRREEKKAFSRWEKEKPQLVTRLHEWRKRGGRGFESLKREILYEYAASL